MKKTLFIYTQVELDTETGVSRVVKHWQKIQGSAPLKKHTLESETPTEEYLD